MEFSRRERLARVGAPRARRVGVGERGTTLPAPLGSAEGETAPRASSQAPALPSLPPSKRVVALTVAGGWRLASERGWAASAVQSGSPLRGVRAGGWGVRSRSQRGFYGVPSPRQEGPQAITFGDSHPAASHQRWRGRGEGARAAAGRDRLQEPPTHGLARARPCRGKGELAGC